MSLLRMSSTGSLPVRDTVRASGYQLVRDRGEKLPGQCTVNRGACGARRRLNSARIETSISAGIGPPR